MRNLFELKFFLFTFHISSQLVEKFSKPMIRNNIFQRLCFKPSQILVYLIQNVRQKALTFSWTTVTQLFLFFAVHQATFLNKQATINHLFHASCSCPSHTFENLNILAPSFSNQILLFNFQHFKQSTIQSNINIINMQALKAFIFMLLIQATFTLKHSEVGVNDWHINSLGELKDLYFVKNKITFVGHLGLFGQLDRITGTLENRIILTDGERIINSNEREIVVATRLNQILNYKPSGLEKVVDNRFFYEVTQGRLISTANHSDQEYFLFSKSLFIGKQEIRKCEEDEKFSRLIDSNSLGVFLVTFFNNGHCVQKVQTGNLHPRGCLVGLVEQKIQDTVVYQNYLILAFNTTTVILDSALKQLKRIPKRLIDKVKSSLIFQDASFDLITFSELKSKPIKCSRPETNVIIEENQDNWLVIKEGVQLGTFPKKQFVKIQRAWLNYRSEVDFQLVVQFSDLQLVLYELIRGVFVSKWRKEESLAYIQKVVFMKFSVSDGLDNQYHRNLLSHSYKELSFMQKLALLPRDIMLRLAQEVQDFKNIIFGAFTHALKFVEEFEGEISKFKMSREQQVHYGLRKYMLVLTDWSTVMALDTKSKQIIWKVSSQRNPQVQLISFLKLKKDYQTDAAIRVTYNKQQQIIMLEQIHQNGIITLLKTYQSSVEPTIHKLNDHSLAIKMGNYIGRYDFVPSEMRLKTYYFYSIEEQSVTGWKTEGNGVVQIWNFYLPTDYKLVGSAAAFRGEQRTHIPLYEDNKVFFKNVDFTNLALLGVKKGGFIELFILNGRTGHVQFNEYKPYVDTTLPINLAYDENNVLVTYFNVKNRFYEIWTVEEYQTRIQNSALNMIGDYLQKREYKPEQNRENIIFESELYGCEVSIKKMFISESKQSLIRRNMIVITKENKIYSIGRELISTRRPKKDGSVSFFSNEKYPEWAYFLPFNPINYISYDVVLHDLSSIRFSSTDMESSIFVFAYGIDSFLIRTAPDRTFDMITDDFNQLVLIIILIVVTIVILFARGLVKLAKLKKPHLQ